MIKRVKTKKDKTDFLIGFQGYFHPSMYLHPLRVCISTFRKYCYQEKPDNETIYQKSTLWNHSIIGKVI